MFLSKSLELTEARIEYDHMLRQCNHLRGLDLDTHREAMDELATKIQDLRRTVDGIIHRSYPESGFGF